MSDKLPETPELLLARHKMETVQTPAARPPHKGADVLHMELCHWWHIIVSLPRVKLMEVSIQENTKEISFEGV